MDRLTGLTVPLCFVIACTGLAQSSDEAGNDTGTGGGESGSGGGGRLGSDGSDSDPLNRNPALSLTCADPTKPTPGASPLVRLTTAEYNNTLRDLFAGLAVPSKTLPAENVVDGFSNNARGQTPSADLIEGLESSAVAISSGMGPQLGKLMPCQASNAAEEDTCATQFIEAFGKRAFRRPLTADETKRFKTFVTTTRATYDFNTAMTMLVGGMLQSPQFLYRVELGDNATPAQGAVALTNYELASRLSYLLWDTMPDDDLFKAADKGELNNPAAIKAQAERLLGDPRAKAVVADFHEQWLDLQRIERNAITKNPQLFPAFKSDTAAAMAKSTRMFVERAFWEGGSKMLFLDNHAYVNATLAPIYGVPAPTGSQFVLTELESKERAGFLSQAGVLAGLAHETLQSPVLRGIFVINRFLCATVLPPPPGVNTKLPDLPEGKTLTTRRRFEQIHEQGTCKGCHQVIDGAGFALENFDAIGQFRSKENGLDIDPVGTLSGTNSDGPVDGPLGLGKMLSQSPQVAQCIVTQWMRYGLSRSEGENDGCTIRKLTDALLDSGGDMRGLLISLATSDSFRYRTPIAP